MSPDLGRRGRSETTALAELKAAQGLTISLCMPARDEEATVGHIVATVRRNLVDRVNLVDEVVVIDDGSTDSTAEAARWEGARVVAVADVLPELVPGSGKGNALWMSVFATDGDIICWVDADVRNFHPEFVTNLIEPLLTGSRDRLREGLLPAPALRSPDRRRSGHRAHGPTVDLVVVSPPHAHRAAARRRVLRPAVAPRGGAVRPGLGCRDRSAHRHRRGVRRRARSRRPTSACASTATEASTTSARKPWRCCSRRSAAPASPPPTSTPPSSASTRTTSRLKVPLEDPRTPPHAHHPRLPHQIRPRTQRVSAVPRRRTRRGSASLPRRRLSR